jgi:DNA-binding MarR family transcriptional regulator
MKPARTITSEDYAALADFRYALRRFLAFSEAAARDKGLTAQQHQALLAIRGAGQDQSIGDLAAKLMIRHHSAVELVDRLVKAGLVSRATSPENRRRVLVSLTPDAEAVLADLSAAHLEELGQSRELLEHLLQRLAN